MAVTVVTENPDTQLLKNRYADPSPCWIERVDCLIERQTADFDFIYNVGADALICKQGQMILAHKGGFPVIGRRIIAHGRRANGVRANTVPTSQ